MGEHRKEAQYCTVLLTAQRGLSGPSSGHSGAELTFKGCFIPQGSSIYRTSGALKLCMDQTTPSYSVQLQGGPELQQRARPCEKGIGQTPGRSRQDAIRLVAQVPCYSPSHVFSFLFFLFLLRAGSDDKIMALKPEQANKRDLSGTGSRTKFLQTVRLGQFWPPAPQLDGALLPCLLECLLFLKENPFSAREMQKPLMPQLLLPSKSSTESSWAAPSESEGVQEGAGTEVCHWLLFCFFLGVKHSLREAGPF